MMDPEEAHEFSACHRDHVEKSNMAGCFYCLEMFQPSEIEKWIDDPASENRPAGQTALCPKCGIDAIVGDKDVPLSGEFLKTMNEMWFGS